MKVAVSASSDSMDGQVNPVFGRCPGFIVAEIEGKEVKQHSFVSNQAAQAAMGAGIAAAQVVVEQGVTAIISGNIGPNAFMVLQQSGIKIYRAYGLTVKQAIQQFIEGKLQEISTASARGHFGMGAGMGAGRGAGRGSGMGAGRGMAQGIGRRRGPPTQ